MMSITDLAEAVGKPVYTVNYAILTHKLCQDHGRVGNARVFTQDHVKELKDHFRDSESAEPKCQHVDAPKSLF